MMFEPQFTCEKTKTTCPYCGVGCGVLAEVDGEGLHISGDETHPANFGRLCSKGSALAETIGLDGRLLAPKINGEQASWDEALSEVAGRFSATIAEYGPDAVAFYVSGQILTEDYYIANKLMKGFIGAANIDTNSRLCMASSVAGHKKAFGADTVPGIYEDFEKADLVILIGSNLAWCHPVIYQRLAAAKQQRPQMKVVLVDPRATMTADIADMHLAIKPDGDVALYMGLLAALAERGKIDEGYVSSYTNGLKHALDNANAVSRQDICAQTGLTVNELETFYGLFADTEKVVSVYSQGVNQSSCGVDKVSAIINCHLATGRIGRAGMGPFSVTGQPNAMGGRETGGLANMLAAHMDIENDSHRALVQNFWKAPVIADKPGLKAVDMFDAVADGRIKAIWIMATNPVDSLPNAGFVEEALKNCPFVIVSDILETTDTMRHAHIALPSLGWGEKDGTVTNSERRISRQRAFLAPPGEAKADWWQFCEVGKRMGFEEAFTYASAKEIFEEHAALSDTENDGKRDFDIGAYQDISKQAYNEMSPFQWPSPKPGEGTAGKPAAREDRRFFAEGDFYTPNRKANFVPVLMPEMPIPDQEYSLVLNTGRVRDHWHTMTRTGKSQRLSAHITEPYVEIHPADAKAHDITEDQIVEVSSNLGRVLGRARLTTRQQKGHVFVPIHWNDQFASLARIGTLIPPVLDPFSGQPAFKNVAVCIKPFAASLYGLVLSRVRPQEPKCEYWAIRKVEAGWLLEFAGKKAWHDINELTVQLCGEMPEKDYLEYEDEKIGDQRAALFDGTQLESALYVSEAPIEVSRTWVIEALGQEYNNPASRHRVLAGRAGAGMPEKGAIICSCFAVGRKQIEEAITSQKAVSVDEIGVQLKAGTNCGSCRSELQNILDQVKSPEEELAS